MDLDIFYISLVLVFLLNLFYLVTRAWMALNDVEMNDMNDMPSGMKMKEIHGA